MENSDRVARNHEPAGWALGRGWIEWARRSWRSRPVRSLQLCETLALGDRQFLSVVRFQQQRFLIVRTRTSLHLLAELPRTILPPATPESSDRKCAAAIGGQT